MQTTYLGSFTNPFFPRHIKYLESRSDLLDAALQQAEESNRRWEEARSVMEVLKRENEILRRALTHQAGNPGALGSLILPPHNPPLSSAPQPNGQSTEDQLPISSANSNDPPGPGPAAAALDAIPDPNGGRPLQDRARELREEGARIAQIQAGARKRRRGGMGGAVNMEVGGDAEEDGLVKPTITMVTNGAAGKRKRQRVAQDAS
jgi:hypothetical protein